MQRTIKKNINGILGTVVFHLVLVVIIMAARLSSVQQQYEQRMIIEFESEIIEQSLSDITETDSDQSDLREDNQGNLRRNIAVNVSEDRPVPDDFKRMSQQDLSELDHRVNEILENAANGVMPELEQPEIKFEPPTEIVRQESGESEPYKGPTTITYDLPGRTHLRMPVPVYKCPDGGIVEVSILVNRDGIVIKAGVDSDPANFNEECINKMALEAALGSRFSSNHGSSEVQSGTITFYFQNQ